ncbi:MAG: nucleotide-binding protein [Clostridia bacterium]|nr:nucleotide-binding protein [Clostridia bacterium]
MNEKIFIAWGGNQHLANEVSAEISKYGYDGIVGGGTIVNMHIGAQVFTQINKSTSAIILVQNFADGDYNLSDNLMFEWGYIVAKFAPNRVHVFLIGMSAKNLPSDLAGSWAREIEIKDRSMQDVAKEIADIFHQNDSNQERMDKLAVVHNHSRILEIISEHNTKPQCTDTMLAYYILHSIESTYYHMDEDIFNKSIERIETNSALLLSVIQMVRANIQLFKFTENLQKPLKFEDFYELTLYFDNDNDLSAYDKELDVWLRMFNTDRMGLCYYFVAIGDELSAEEKTDYLNKSVDCHYKALEILSQICQDNSGDRNYLSLYEGYYYNDLFRCYIELNDDENAKKCIDKAVDARKHMFLTYKQLFPQDEVIVGRLSLEYYLALTEQMKYSDNIMEKKAIYRTIDSYLNKLEEEATKQHSLINRLKSSIDSNIKK